MSSSEEEQYSVTARSPAMSKVGVARELAIVDTSNLPEEKREERSHRGKFFERATYSPGDVQRVARSLKCLDPRIRNVLRHGKHLPIVSWL